MHILHPAGLLLRYILAVLVCCLHPTRAPLQCHRHQTFIPVLFLPILPAPLLSLSSPPSPPPTPVSVVSFPVPKCSHFSAPAYENRWYLVFCSHNRVRIKASSSIHVSPKVIISLFLIAHNIPWCICATFFQSSLLSMGIWVDSRSLLL